jgi:hypothetical protein
MASLAAQAGAGLVALALVVVPCGIAPSAARARNVHEQD